MNKLDPDLKRLLQWSGRAPAAKLEEVPFGFSGRVLAAKRQPQLPTLLQELQRAAWGLTCASLALILCAGFLWIRQRSTPPPAEEVPSALSFLASNFPR